MKTSHAATLKTEIATRITADGPMSIASYMALCLTHPQHGYYVTRDPLGALGDFITAPEISQVFGELAGLWCADMWVKLGRPDPVRLVELGPGRGTLMADALRAACALPGFSEAVEVHLVEASPTLREAQKARLSGITPPVTWHDALDEVPDGAMILITNEFFDALPIRQFQQTGEGWRERLVAMDDAGNLRFVLSKAEPALPGGLSRDHAKQDAIVELCEPGIALAGEIGRRCAAGPGAALIVDYGYSGAATGDSFQAVRGHEFCDPLVSPGEADLTAHVDFTTLEHAAEAAGARSFGPVAQGDFLRALGIDIRLARLVESAGEAQRRDLVSGVRRLTDPDDMGILFKALAIAGPEADPPAGF